MEQEVAGIVRSIFVEVEAEHDLNGVRLKRPERPLCVASEVELRVALECLFEDPGIAHRVEAPKPRLFFPVRGTDEERPRSACTTSPAAVRTHCVAVSPFLHTAESVSRIHSRISLGPELG